MEDIPKGNIAKTHGGGPNSLEPVVDRVKKFGFTGYIRTTHGGSAGTEGFIFFVDGEPRFYIHRKLDGNQETRGPQAMKAINEDAALIDSSIEVHTNIDVMAVLGKLQKQTPVTATTRRSSRRAILAWGKAAETTDEDKRKMLKERLEHIKAEGYEIDVDKLVEGELEDVQAAVSSMEKSFQKMEEAKRQLEELKPILREKELAAADKLMKNLSRVAEAEKLIELLEKKADKMKREGEKDKAEKVEEELAARKEEKERNVRAEQVYEMVIKHQQGVKPREECAKCGSELDDGGSCSKCTEEKEGTNGSGAKLHPEYRFENFVIGNSNHFAHAAAVAVADDPATTYNPLFIWSRPGLGKTHLLNAIANRILDKHKGMRISYFTTEQFISDLVEHMKKGKLDEFRREYRRADILIVDDIQFLAESERSQEEFFHTFNALYTVDKQIVLASDRPPKEIPTLKQRLVSRFEGGLIVEVQQPDYETRLAILKQKEADKNIHVQDEVLSYIAKSVKSNIRELEGALNKVAAFASFTKRDADLDLAKEVLKDMSLEEGEEEPPPEEKVEASAPVEGLQKLTPGHSYLVEEQSLSKAVELFKHCLKPGKTGMAVVRTNPTRVEKEHKLKSLAELYWLTDRDSKKSKTIPPSLEKLIWEMGTFIEENDGGALLLDGLDYLASANSFDAVTTFIRRMVDSIAETDSILIISLSPDTMEKQQVKILEREMDVISFL